MISGHSLYLMTKISDTSSSLEKRCSTSMYLEIGSKVSFTLVKKKQTIPCVQNEKGGFFVLETT